jgi:CHRD domain
MKPHRILAFLAALAGLVVLGSSAASAQDAQLFAVLNGGNEVGPTGLAAAGDLDGAGNAAVSLVAADLLCFTILVNHLDPPAMAHIHQGVTGTNGPIVVNLVPPVGGELSASARCVPGIDPILLESIRRSPAEFYVNVHTGAFPAGAVRGQLF